MRGGVAGRGTRGGPGGIDSIADAQLAGLGSTGILKWDGAALGIAVAGTDYEVPLTFASGLTRTANTVRNDLITGKAGGQTIISGTASGENLTYSSTSHATKGKHIWGTTAKMYYDEAAEQLALGTATPNAGASVHLHRNVNSTLLFFVTNNSTGAANIVSLRAGQNPADETQDFCGLTYLGSGVTASGLITKRGGLVEIIPSTGTPTLGISNYANGKVSIATNARVVRADFDANGMTLADGHNIVGGTGTGTKLLTGANQPLGFHGAAPVAQQTVTGSRGGNAALADLLTKLATLGLIVDGSS